MSGLKPCPFCGGEPTSRSRMSGESEGYETTFIISCECGSQFLAKDDLNKLGWVDANGKAAKCKAVEGWNTRAVPDVPELVLYSNISGWDGLPCEYIDEDIDGEYVRYDQVAPMLAAKDAKVEVEKAKMWLVAAEFKERAEVAEAKLTNLKEINANLMGDDEDKPRYTTKRLKHEIEKAAEAKLAQYEAQKPVGYRYQNCFGGEPFSDQMWQYASFPVTKQGDATDFACEPLYASPAPCPDLKAENERLRDALKKIHAKLEADRTGMFEGLKNIINVALGDANA